MFFVTSFNSFRSSSLHQGIILEATPNTFPRVRRYFLSFWLIYAIYYCILSTNKRY